VRETWLPGEKQESPPDGGAPTSGPLGAADTRVRPSRDRASGGLGEFFLFGIVGLPPLTDGPEKSRRFPGEGGDGQGFMFALGKPPDQVPAQSSRGYGKLGSGGYFSS
jgi:hypothetical protein